jgi:hypothetical protein
VDLLCIQEEIMREEYKDMDENEVKLADILNEYKEGRKDLGEAIRNIFGVFSDIMGS